MRRVVFLSERMRLGFGVDLVIHELARRLVGRFDVAVCTSVDDGTYHGHGYPIHRYPTPHAVLGWAYERAARRNARELLALRPDVLVPATFPFFGVPSRIGIPSIAYDFGVVPSAGMPTTQALLVEYMRLTNHWWHLRAEAVVTCSDFLRRQFSPLARPKTHVIPLGADHVREGPPLPSREALRRARGIRPDEVVFASIGRLDVSTPYKGVADLVEIFQRVRLANDRVRLVMRGFGTPVDEAQLHFQGVDARASVPLAELREVLQLCDVYVTGTRWEGFDLPLAEAQALGRPVVAYAVGAHPEVVQGGGFLVRTQDEFVARLEQLAADAALRAEMSAAALAWSARFSWDRAAEAFGDVVEAVLQ